MAQEEGATLTEGATQQVEGEGTQDRSSLLTPRHDARESALESIAARRNGGIAGSEQPEEAAAAAVVETPAQDGGETASGEQTESAATAAAQTDPHAELAAQIARQLADGKLVLTDDILAKSVVKTKIDGVEEEVPAVKPLSQYQKNGAADVRLAEATRAAREAQDLLTKAQATAASATTSAPAKQEPAPKQEEAAAEIARLTQEHAAAIYNGDDEKAAKLLGDIIDAKLKGRLPESTPAVSVEDVVKQALPAMKQQLSVESALAQLKTDYPEIYADRDIATLADIKLAELEAAGKSRPEAIAEVGEILGAKFGFGKHKKTDAPAPAATTTRDLKLAAKAGLDEPKSAATRAPSTVQAPMTRSSVIAEMAAARGQNKAP